MLKAPHRVGVANYANLGKLSADHVMMGARATSRAWIAYLAVGAVALCLFLVVPRLGGLGLVLPVASGSSAIVIFAGIRIHRPAAVWPWRWFGVAQVLFFLGEAYAAAYLHLLGHDVPFPGVADVFYLLAFPALMTGVLLAVRRRTPQGDRAGVIDALILTAGLALLSWVFLMAPYVHDATLSSLAKGVSIAYPLGDVLVLAAALGLAFDGGRHRSSFVLLATSLAVLLMTDAARGYSLLEGTFDNQLIYDAGRATFYLLWGAAALHPSMRTFAEATPDRARRLSWRRLGLLTTASLVAPAIQLVRGFQDGDVDEIVIVSAALVVFLLVIARVAGLVHQHERAVARERALGSANLALVEAATPEAIATVALRTAEALIDSAGEARLCVQRPIGLILASTASRAETIPAPASVRLLELAATAPHSAIALPPALCTDLELPAGFVSANVFPLAAREARRGLLIVASPTPLSPILVTAIDGLSASVSLALESAALTEQVHRQENEERFASLVRNASDLISVVDGDGDVVYQSPSIQKILGLTPASVSGLPFANLLAPDDRAALLSQLETIRRGGARSQAFECSLLHSDGRMLKFEIVATDLCDEQHVGGIVLNGRDASERAAFEQQLEHQSFHDAVTGLPNRAMFVNSVDRAIARTAGGRARAAVLLLDLDDFKTINDSLGHAVGDELLQQVATRLRAVVRKVDTMARFGGDEFAILVEGVRDSQAAVELVERIERKLAQPIRVAGHQILVRASTGIALSGGGAYQPGEAGDVIRSADAAMHTCKRDERGSYRVFETAMHARVLERLELRGELRRAIDSQQFELHFQPIVDLRDGSAGGAEALVRWHHPTRGFVHPDQFIPLAEEMGLIVELGRWVLRESCRCASALRTDGAVTGGFTIGVNISVKHLQHPDVVADVRDALEAAGLPPEMLVLEVTETVLIADHELASQRLHQLKALGVRIAIDDFGAGYSSLGYLNSFAVDFLKLDRSFLETRAAPDSPSLAGAIVALGASLGLAVVAEGIERAEQYDELRSLGCAFGQGFLIGRPMDMDGLRAWLAIGGRTPLHDVVAA